MHPIKIIKQLIKQPALWLILIGAVILIAHLHKQPINQVNFKSERLYHFNLSMNFEAGSEELTLRTYLPLANQRQEIIEERIESSSLSFADTDTVNGRQGVWNGQSKEQVKYSAVLATSEEQYVIDPEILIPKTYPIEFDKWLQSTDAMPKDHPEITSIWQEIRTSNDKKVYPILESIYNFTHKEIAGAPFKGFTDALTALRLRQASCNGKSRLFVSLARLNNLPARLIGGVILNDGAKKTSHQWVEVYLEGHWVPFDPTNGHYAKLPSNYLELYLNDQALFSHTRNINFDYLFKIKRDHIASSLIRYQNADSVFPNAALTLSALGITNKAAVLFLLFPLAALAISFVRNVIGLKTFGVFMPMLVASACVYTGLLTGLIGLVAVVTLAYLGQSYFAKHRLLKIPRLSAIITLNTIIFIILLMLIGNKTNLEFGMLTLFPVIIISFIAEKLSTLTQDNNWIELIKVSLGSVFLIILCYLIFSSVVLQSLFVSYPEMLLFVLALQISIGKWSGLRITEYFRFKGINTQDNTLGINKRNREFVYSMNEPNLLELAIDKIKSKELLLKSGIPVPQTIQACHSFLELEHFIEQLTHFNNFVIKPNRGSQGNGIIVFISKDDGKYITPSGKKYSLNDIAHHVKEIISGGFSQDGQPDIAYIEPLLEEHPAIASIANIGLSDIRLILCRQNIISCMLRVPTRHSDGKANLHQGAIGISVNIQSGITEHASFKGQVITKHPDSNTPLIGIEIPFWKKICTMALHAQEVIPLGYIGVDICLDHKLGPLILEVNGRPGIEIQNVQNEGFANKLDFAKNET